MWIFLENVAAIAIIFVVLFIIWNVLKSSKPSSGGISLDDLPEPEGELTCKESLRVAKFKVGDRVRLINQQALSGSAGTVEECDTHANLVHVRLENTTDDTWFAGRLWLVDPVCLELIEDENEPPAEDLDKGDTFITLNELGTMVGMDMSSKPESDNSIPVGTYVQVIDSTSDFLGENGRVLSAYMTTKGVYRYYVEMNDDESLESFLGSHLKVIDDSEDEDTDLCEMKTTSDNTHEVPPGTMNDLLGSGPDLCRLCACSGICEQQNFLMMVQDRYDIAVGVYGCPEFVTHDEAESAEWIPTLGERGKNSE